MNVKRWIARREPSWKQLDELLLRIEKRGARSLSTDEIKKLASLYRSVSGDLARARTYQTLVGNTIVQDLQRLTSRSYSQIYQGSRHQEWQAVREFILWGFPAVVQSAIAYILLATAIFVVGMLIAWWFAWRDPAFLSLVVPESMIRMVRDENKLWMGSILGIEPLAATGIMTNNMTVSFRVVAGGMTLGLLSVYILFFNGVLIGAVGALVGQNNLGYPFWAFVFPHGSLELPAIFLAGGAAFLIARGLLFPGKLRRIDAIKVYGVQAAQLVVGVVVMLFVAGIIEGFFSPSPLVPEPLKYLTGLVLFMVLVLYCGRRKPQQL
jgi:uncharacterized membrane protein SpoIIM required for sporulation